MATSKIKNSKPRTPKRAPVVPETATVDHGHEYPAIPVMPPFLLVYNPQRWGIIGGRVVPFLHSAPLREGVNGVTKSRAGAWRLAKLKDQIESLGRTVIPWNKGPDGSYIDEVETRTPSGAVAPSFVSCFTATFAGSKELRADLKGYVAWLESLMKDGTLPAPPPYVIERMLSDKRGELLRAKDAHQRSSSASDAAAVKALESQVRQLTALDKGASKTPASKRAATISEAAE